MIRLLFLLAALGLAGAAQAATLKLERVVVVMRHGVRPPTQENDQLRKWSDKDWPAWPVKAGELTQHGGETVRLMGATLRRTYRAKGLLPAAGCAGPHQVTVWADGEDQRTRKTGEILAKALQPGCGATAPFRPTPPDGPRDPIFGGYQSGPCSISAKERALFSPLMASPAQQAKLDLATARLQAIFAPNACEGGAGTCFKLTGPAPGGVYPGTASLAEDLLLEYAEGMPMKDVGWGRSGRAGILAVMPLHERSYEVLRANTAATSKLGSAMARVIFDGLNGRPASGGPDSGPDLKLMGLAGHDTNIALMASLFGLTYALPGEPDGTAPSTALAFELWTDGTTQYVRPVIYYETLDQLRRLKPAEATALPLTFADCATGPMGGCPLATIETRVEAMLPGDCDA
ncbi:MAG TPA: histidine-type phosphatase [Caulobacteraceae bacterium]|nr:histidine-type phosphatase [Caulobacteraceae bacterium]